MEINLPDAIGCDVNLIVNETKQYISTEGYPSYYKSNQDCHFNFEAPPGIRIVVFFVDFHLESEFDFIHFCELHNLIKTLMLTLHKTQQ